MNDSSIEMETNEYEDRKYMEAEKTKMRQQLQDAICEVVFTKQDGTERKMKCTTNRRYIPEDKLPSSESIKKTPDTYDDLFVVFDTEQAGWRSFNYPTMKSFAFPGKVDSNT